MSQLQVDWDQFDLVVFDVDGTLYDQKKLRLTMMFQLFKHAVTTLDISIFPIIKHYRKIRETLGDEEVFDFEAKLVKKTSEITGQAESRVVAVINEWIETRPLPYLSAARYDGLLSLFTAIKQQHKTLGILSDYRATAKVNALGLAADLVVSAQDDDVNVLKPHPKGLEAIANEAGVEMDRVILIGDRDERDGEAARRAGAQYLIKQKSAAKPVPHNGFLHYTDPVFKPLFDNLS